MHECVETKRLILHRHIFDDGTVLAQMNKKNCCSSPQALSLFLKHNQELISGIFGWWLDVASPYSAGWHIHDDARAWRHKEQLQYYIYEKETQKCVGIFCALIKNNEAYVLAWLSKEGQKKGYASEVALSFEKELFETLGVDKIKYECFNLNPYKKRVASFLIKMNYQEEITPNSSTLWIKTRDDYFKIMGVKPLLIKSKKIGVSFFNRFKNIFVREV